MAASNSVRGENIGWQPQPQIRSLGQEQRDDNMHKHIIVQPTLSNRLTSMDRRVHGHTPEYQSKEKPMQTSS